jgi:AcrR family transcriptional regulator
VADIQLGRRDRKKLTTHQLLRSAAFRLVAERSLAQVTVEDIADEADVSVRTFYDHFASKEDAIVGFDASRVDQLREALSARPQEESPLMALRSVLRELLEESGEEWSLRMRVIRSDPALLARMFASFAISERAMIEVIAARTGTDADQDLFPGLITAVATGAFRASIAVWRSNNESLALADVFDAAFELVSAGLPLPDLDLDLDHRPASPRTSTPPSCVAEGF